MDKKRRLEIKHPHLRKIRNSLRYVIVEETYRRLDKLRKKQEPYDKVQSLQRALNASICKCSKCASTTSDMIHNPYDKNWYCVDCYEKLQYWYKYSPNSTERKDAPNPFP